MGDGAAITVSTAFGPTWEHDGALPDIFILSSDAVYFSVHSQRVYLASANRFEGRIPEQRGPRAITSNTGPIVVALPEPAVVVQIMLYAIYGTSYGNQQPGFDAIAQTVEAMKKYWIHLHAYLQKGAPLFALYLGQAPLRPLEAFTIAAENELEALAVDVSPYVMPINPEDIPDDLAIRMGPLYLKRLWGLRCTRRETMRNIAKTGPYPHAPSRRCSQADRLGLTRAWSLAGGQLIWDFRPGMPTFLRRCARSLTT
ncbi:hypothetical protein EIP86_008323 [Pleurotus ostreatoroseus]|nr:hypothetical protein EIP86_008323 [Pleurotus ostreatoroseus]